MTLTVLAPGPDPITTHASGVKIVRLADYIGGARGTLTTVADADSPAGTVIKDTQELAAATTLTGRGGSVSDTVSIPVADLAVGADAFYTGYLGVRLTGRPPVGARATEKWQYQNLSAGPSICRVHDTTVTEYYEIPREFYAGYTLIRAGSFTASGFSGVTNLRFRAFGITGGAMEFYLDLLYMVPLLLQATDDTHNMNPDAFGPLYLPAGGTDLGPDVDNNTTNSISTAHSVMPDFYFDSVWDFDVSYDIQEDDYEKSIVDWHNIFSGEPNREASFFYFRAGSRLAEAHTIETEDFSAYVGGTPISQTEESTEGYVIETAAESFNGSNTSAPGGPWLPGWYFMNTSLQFLGPDAASGIGILPLGAGGADAEWDIGAHTVRPVPVSGSGPSDPRNVAPILQGFDSFMQVYKVNLMMGHAGADVEMHFGTGRWSAINQAHQTRVTVTAKVVHHADGTHAIALETYCEFGSSPTYEEFVSPVTVMGALSPGDSYWVRVEKRFNHWRARCWVDGDTEPAAWDVQGFAPAWISRDNSVTVETVPHPYNNSWPADVTDVFEDPRFWHGGGSTTATPTPWMQEAKIRCLAGFNTSNYEIQIDEFTLSYDPDFEGGGTAHTGAYFRAEKYDGTVDWGTAYLPPGAWRIVVSDFASHHFHGDTHGGNVYAWKETGGYPLQAAAWEIFTFRRPTRRPRWGDITYP